MDRIDSFIFQLASTPGLEVQRPSHPVSFRTVAQALTILQSCAYLTSV